MTIQSLLNVFLRELPYGELNILCGGEVKASGSVDSSGKKSASVEVKEKSNDGKLSGGVKVSAEQNFLYELPKVESGKLRLRNVLAVSQPRNELCEESVGEFEWPLDKMNLLLDMSHGRVMGVDRKIDVHGLEYDVRKCAKVKCTINKKGIFFKGKTSFGDLKMSLSTSCNQNVVNKALLKSNPTSSLASISIGGRVFNDLRFSSHEITAELEVDVVLGNEFLQQHIVFIDARNEYLYFGEAYWNTISERPFAKIPLKFTYEGLPVIEIELNRKRHNAVLDLGSGFELLCPADDFSVDHLPYIHSSRSVDVCGQEEVNKYYLDSCKIHGSTLKHLILGKKNAIGVNIEIKKARIGTLDAASMYYIGLPVLFRTNIFFDFPHSSLCFVPKTQNLERVGIDLDGYEKIHFRTEKTGIILTIKCDVGDVRLLLDTGSGISLINANLLEGQPCIQDSSGNPCFMSRLFQIGSLNFPETIVYSFPFSSKFDDIDGILGMDFLKDHPFYIDYENKSLYLQKAAESGKVRKS